LKTNFDGKILKKKKAKMLTCFMFKKKKKDNIISGDYIKKLNLPSMKEVNGK